MKPTLTLLLSLLLLCPLVSCSSDVEDNEEKDVEVQEEKKDAEVQEEEKDTEAEKATEAPEEAEEKVFISGTTTEKAYENTSMGIGFSLPDGWSFASKEEMANIFGSAQDSITEIEAELLEQTNYSTEFYASNELGESVSLIVEKTNTASYVENNIADIAKNTILILKAELEKVYDSLDMEEKTIELAGKEYYGYSSIGSVSGFDLYQSGIFINYGGYIGTVSIGTMSSEAADTVMEGFYSIESKE